MNMNSVTPMLVTTITARHDAFGAGVQRAAQHDREVGQHEHAQQHGEGQQAVGQVGLDEHAARPRRALSTSHGTRKQSEQAEHLGAHVVAVRQRQAEHELQRAFLALVHDADTSRA